MVDNASPTQPPADQFYGDMDEYAFYRLLHGQREPEENGPARCPPYICIDELWKRSNKNPVEFSRITAISRQQLMDYLADRERDPYYQALLHRERAYQSDGFRGLSATVVNQNDPGMMACFHDLWDLYDQG